MQESIYTYTHTQKKISYTKQNSVNIHTFIPNVYINFHVLTYAKYENTI
jgi:hypothetical protein